MQAFERVDSRVHGLAPPSAAELKKAVTHFDDDRSAWCKAPAWKAKRSTLEDDCRRGRHTHLPHPFNGRKRAPLSDESLMKPCGGTVFVSVPSTTSHKTGGRRRGRPARAGWTCRCTAWTRSTSQCCRHTKDEEGGAVEDAAWRIGRECARCEVTRGLVGQVERRGGGIALALGRDEGVTAGAALDHACSSPQRSGGNRAASAAGRVRTAAAARVRAAAATGRASGGGDEGDGGGDGDGDGGGREGDGAEGDGITPKASTGRLPGRSPR
eukprot:scaffold41350_cov62-Phaeocystis_antarctica.AAC.4